MPTPALPTGAPADAGWSQLGALVGGAGAGPFTGVLTASDGQPAPTGPPPTDFQLNLIGHNGETILPLHMAWKGTHLTTLKKIKK